MSPGTLEASESSKHITLRPDIWPHRAAILIAIVICLVAASHRRLVDPALSIPVALSPYLLLEAVGYIPRGPKARILFMLGSLCVIAGMIFYAPRFSQHSWEWTPLIFLFLPTSASVYASRLASRRTAQNSRSGWFATPFL